MKHRSARIGENVTIGHGVVIDEDVIIGNDVFIGHNSVIRNGVTLGRGVVVGHLVVIEQMTSIEKNTVVQSQCHITAHATIGANVFFGAAVVCLNEWTISKWRNDRIKQVLKGPVIKDWCRIGTRSLIMPGVTIGEHAIIGAGAIITKNVAPYEKWYGECARCRGMSDEYELIGRRDDPC